MCIRDREYGLEVFGGKWKSRVICVLADKKTLRYSELRTELVNITDAVLSTTLKALIADDIVSRLSLIHILSNLWNIRIFSVFYLLHNKKRAVHNIAVYCKERYAKRISKGRRTGLTYGCRNWWKWNPSNPSSFWVLRDNFYILSQLSAFVNRFFIFLFLSTTLLRGGTL